MKRTTFYHRIFHHFLSWSWTFLLELEQSIVVEETQPTDICTTCCPGICAHLQSSMLKLTTRPNQFVANRRNESICFATATSSPQYSYLLPAIRSWIIADSSKCQPNWIPLRAQTINVLLLCDRFAKLTIQSGATHCRWHNGSGLLSETPLSSFSVG